MTFGEAKQGSTWGAIADVDQNAADRIVERSLASGVNFIDTADVYSSGESERLLGQALKNLDIPRKDVVIATKVYGVMGDKPNDRGASRGHIMDSVEASLKRLQTDHIDLYQIHATDTVTPIEETLRAFDDLVSRGLVRYIGVSNWQAWRISKALGLSERRGFARFETVQAYYSIAGRDLERDIVPMMQEEKLGLLVWSPLAGGRVFSSDEPAAQRVRAKVAAVAEALQQPFSSVVFAGIMQRPCRPIGLTGSGRIEAIAEAVQATQFSLSRTQWFEILRAARGNEVA
jgi:aryl-alcohol dehydrogenase-like predicted oxidoreductase